MGPFEVTAFKPQNIIGSNTIINKFIKFLLKGKCSVISKAKIKSIFETPLLKQKLTCVSTPSLFVQLSSKINFAKTGACEKWPERFVFCKKSEKFWQGLEAKIPCASTLFLFVQLSLQKLILAKLGVVESCISGRSLSKLR